MFCPIAWFLFGAHITPSQCGQHFLSHEYFNAILDAISLRVAHGVLKELGDLAGRTEARASKHMEIRAYTSLCTAFFIRHNAELRVNRFTTHSDVALCDKLNILEINLQRVCCWLGNSHQK